MSTPGGGLNALPTELLGKIFLLVLHGGNSKKSRCSLMLVCRQWREYVEGSAFLWTTISVLEGLATMRRALELSKGAMLDLHWGLPMMRPVEIEMEAFMAEAGPHIARWQSLYVDGVSEPGLRNQLAPLTTTQAPSLKTLHLSPIPDPGDAFTLFGGAPAPSTLKELGLARIAVEFEPLKLSGLRSLSLLSVPTITTPHLFEILRRCPSLESLSLGGSQGLIDMGSPASNIPPIELPKLDYLGLRWMDFDLTKCILSNIRIPNRRRVVIRDNTGWNNAASRFFTSSIAHLLHTTIPSADFPSLVVTVWGATIPTFKIEFRGLEISCPTNESNRGQEILRWLADGLGSEVAEFPVRLTLDDAEWWKAGFPLTPVDPPRVAIPLVTVPPPFIVKHLSIAGRVSKTWREDIHIAMARPTDLTAPGWLYPQLESLSVHFWSVEEQEQLVSMLRSRYEGATIPGATELRCPVGLRSVELRGNPRTEGLVEEIKGILGEANVFWADEETPRNAWGSGW